MEEGKTYSIIHIFTQDEFDEFARLSGDDNPIHVDRDFAAQTPFGKPVAHGMMLYGMICGLISQHFPTAVQLEQQLVFPAPTFAGEPMNITIEVARVEDDFVTLNTLIINGNNTTTCEGHSVLRTKNSVQQIV